VVKEFLRKEALHGADFSSGKFDVALNRVINSSAGRPIDRALPPETIVQSVSRSIQPFFAGLTDVTNTYTDTETDRGTSRHSNRPYL